MSATVSAVVKKARLGPIEAAHLEIACSTVRAAASDVAGERVGGAGAALVEDDQITGVGDRAEQFGELFGERQRRLAGAAGERDDRGPGIPDRGPVTADRQGQGPGCRAARVQRDGEVRAGVLVGFRAGGVGDVRAGRGRRSIRAPRSR